MKYLDLDGLTHFWEIIKNKINTKVDVTGGDTSNTVIKTMDTISTEFPVPVAGESTKTFAGKVKKFITDFNSFKTGIITVGKLVNNFQTTNTGFALDARAGKTLNDAITQLNSDLQYKKLRTYSAFDYNDVINVLNTEFAKLNNPGKTNFKIGLSKSFYPFGGGSWDVEIVKLLDTYGCVSFVSYVATGAKRYSCSYNDGTWGVWDYDVTTSDLQNYTNLGILNSIIQHDEDLRSSKYQKPGNYACSQNEIAATLINCPTDQAFVMRVYYGTGISSRYIVQEIHTHNGMYIYKQVLLEGTEWKIYKFTGALV